MFSALNSNFSIFFIFIFSQTLFSQTSPDSSGFFIYDDEFSVDVVANNWSGGTADFQSIDSPNNGDYCIRWDDANLYGSINIDFIPDRDFSYLVENNYALDLMVRGNSNDIWFDIRFIDTDGGPGSNNRPWRMRATLNQNHGPWDGRWHHLHIPFDEMGEHGSWDDNAWHLPIGAFDWAAIDVLQIVPEDDPLHDRSLWFDNIHITELDTALVYDNSVFEVISSLENMGENFDFKIFPNPSTDFITIKTRKPEKVIFKLNTVDGKTVLKGDFEKEKTIDLTQLPKGIYWLNLAAENELIQIQKIILQ